VYINVPFCTLLRILRRAFLYRPQPLYFFQRGEVTALTPGQKIRALYLGYSGAWPPPPQLSVARSSPASGASPAPCAQPLLDPAHCCAAAAPAQFDVDFLTTAGLFTLHCERAWAPLGVDRFYNMIKFHYLDNTTLAGDNDAAFFRVVPGFVVQFGIAGLPAVSAPWENLAIKDDPVILSNIEGTIAFATAGPNTRTTQVYINLGNNARLDSQGFTVFGNITAGLPIVHAINAAAGEKPDQDLIYSQGNAYLRTNFPQLDYTLKTILKE
jgi:peptidyl-prolyl cis-trans isomerase A (cyclophilin A)